MQTRLVPQDFELVSGNDKTINFTHRDRNGVAVDITGATITWALSNTAKSKTPIISYTSPTNIAITEPLNGKYTVSIQDTDTEPLPGGEYYHEVRISDSGGRKSTGAIGTVTVLPNIIDT